VISGRTLASAVHTAFLSGLPLMVLGLVAALMLEGTKARSSPRAWSWAALMHRASTFRYCSFKGIDFARGRPTWVLLLVVLAVLMVATHPQWFLFLLFSAYVVSGLTRPLWARRRDGAFLGDKGLRNAR
jgi:phosphatidylserine synthase